jgi:hypothetical protein
MWRVDVDEGGDAIVAVLDLWRGGRATASSVSMSLCGPNALSRRLMSARCQVAWLLDVGKTSQSCLAIALRSRRIEA